MLCVWILLFTVYLQVCPSFSIYQYFILFIAELYFTLCTYHIMFSHLSSNEHIGWFHFFVIINNTTRRIHTQEPLCEYVFSFLLCRYLGVELLNNSINLCLTLESGCTIIQSHLQCTRTPVSLCLCQHLALSVFLIIAIPGGCSSNLYSWITNDAAPFHMLISHL